MQKDVKKGNNYLYSLMVKQKTGSEKKKNKQKKEEHNKIEMALAISIILANLSCDLDFIGSLLGAQKWALECQEQVEASPSKKILNGQGKEVSARP